MELYLRPTVINGDTIEDDFVVIHDGRRVGRIRLATERAARGEIWDWGITVPVPIGVWRGSASTLDEAKERFKAAWEQVFPTIPADDIAHWHHHQDAAEERWVKGPLRPAGSADQYGVPKAEE